MRRHTIEEPDDAVTLLRAQQRDIDALLATLVRARAVPQKAALVAELGDLVAVHLALVRLALRPVLVSLGENPACLEAGTHAEVSSLLAELLESDVGEPGFDAVATTFRDRLAAYAAEVERCALKDLRTRLPQTSLRHLAHEMRVLEFELRVNAAPRRAISGAHGRATAAAQRSA